MKYRRRIYYSAAQRAEIWDCWKAGESMSSIGRRFDRESSSVFSVLSPTGGIRPPLSVAAPDRSGAGSIAVHGQPRGSAQRRAGGVSGDTIGSGNLGPGLASQALQAGLPTGSGPGSIGQASSQLVARADRRLAQAHLAGEPHSQVSHETIYRSLFIQTRGVLRKNCWTISGPGGPSGGLGTPR